MRAIEPEPGFVEYSYVVAHAIEPGLLIDTDTWRFSFFLDLLFSDGGHLVARANGVELDVGPNRSQSFGIE